MISKFKANKEKEG